MANNAIITKNELITVLRDAVKEVLTEATESDYLTTNQACELLQVSSRTLRNWELEGRLRAIYLSRRRKVYSRDSIRALLEAGLTRRGK